MTDRSAAAAALARWWEGAVVYQIYPRSFADANGDGIGDLAGILGRLDHLRGGDASLGVDAIWLSPVHPSPLHDFGYDVADYTDIAPEFGSLDDFDRLVAACHDRGLRVLLDFVPCHTSVDHPWFVDSRSGRGSARRDWYVWADPAPDGGPPTNWQGAFGGSTWEWDAASGQYYLHTFYPEQPNLNWRNPAVADAMHEAMRFWFRRGVDGFRVDAIQAAIVDELLRDNPPFSRPSEVPGLNTGEGSDMLWHVDRPEVADVARGMRRVADEFDGRILMAEVYAPVERLGFYLADDAFHLAFNFEPLLAPWSYRDLALAIERAEARHPSGAVPTYAFSNHDRPRHATRWGRERARLAAFLLLTLRGVAVLYAGEEIGMVDADPSVLPDPPYDRAGRDGVRTPMQWRGGPGAGFTTGEPWLPIVDADVANVADQQAEGGSLLQLYRRLIAVRRQSDPLRIGSHRSYFDVAPDVLAYVREAAGRRVLCLANTADLARDCELRRAGATSGEVLVGTGERAGRVQLEDLRLAPLEGLALLLD